MNTLKTFDMANYNTLKIIAEDFHKSGALPKSLDNVHKVIMILQAWSELWLTPIKSLNSMYFVNGKLSLYGETAVLLMKQAGYKIKINEMTSKVCKITISYADESQDFDYTIEEAKHAGLLGSAVWTKYPRVMLMYKCFALARKFFAPDCLGGYLIKEELDGEKPFADQAVPDEADVLDGFEKSTDIQYWLKVEMADPEPSVEATVDPAMEAIENLESNNVKTPKKNTTQRMQDIVEEALGDKILSSNEEKSWVKDI